MAGPSDAKPRRAGRPLAVVLLALTALACSPAAPNRPSLLLITLDTTRVEALGVYGGRKGVTPQLDALAAESLVYEAARTVAPITPPGHASMLTGLYPPRHGLVDNGLAALPQAASTLAERACEQGLASAAFVSAVVLDRSFGLDQGLEVYDTPNARREGSSHAERSAQATLAAAGEWLAQRDRSRAFLLWAHLFDPHMPYAPDERILRQAKGSAYLGEVAAMDAAIGELLAGLREDGTLASTIVVIVADHGESLGQHGERTQGAFVYDSTMKVPLLVRYPDGWGAGRRSREIVSVVDLFSTLCEGLELGSPGAVDGLSSWRRSVPEGRGVYFESYNDPSNGFALERLAATLDTLGRTSEAAAVRARRAELQGR